MILPILINPNPILRTPTKDVKPEDIKRPNLQNLLRDMAETMHNAPGIGLAAPQIGQSLRLTVIDIGKAFPNSSFVDGKTRVFINPYILNKSFRKIPFEEGCLSIPGIFGWVKRPEKITVRYLDQSGKKQTEKFDDLMARVLQHEIDHLEGVLFIDKVEWYTKNEQVIPPYPHR